jgi:hypothetical protein
MIDALPAMRRPAPGFAWRALALFAGPALLLAATVLPTVLLLGRLPRYEVPPRIDQIASVEVARMHLLRSPTVLLLPTHLALRDGPALVVRTSWGARRRVTVADAEDAAAALRTWIAQDQATG